MVDEHSLEKVIKTISGRALLIDDEVFSLAKLGQWFCDFEDCWLLSSEEAHTIFYPINVKPAYFDGGSFSELCSILMVLKPSVVVVHSNSKCMPIVRKVCSEANLPFISVFKEVKELDGVSFHNTEKLMLDKPSSECQFTESFANSRWLCWDNEHDAARQIQSLALRTSFIKFVEQELSAQSVKVESKTEVSLLTPFTLQRYAKFLDIDANGMSRMQVHADIGTHSSTQIKSRDAVMTFQAFDVKGDEINVFDGKLAYSKQLNSHFLYLADTASESRLFVDTQLNDKVAHIRISLMLFSVACSYDINVRNMTVTLEEQKAIAPTNVDSEAIQIAGWPEEQVDSSKPNVVGIMDEFTSGCFKDDTNLIQPRPDNWGALSKKYLPDLFFIESAWKGNSGSWQYRVANYNFKPGDEVRQMCSFAKAKNIPSIFWNKEDPVHHTKFLCSAELADYVFTTDANMITSYQKKLGHNRVYSLPFAAQPSIHYPAPLDGRKPYSCFAGSWYGDRHESRANSMKWLLKAANKYGLEIFDRNYGTGAFPFPEEYQSGIRGSLPYDELCKEYRNYRVFLNVNSVTDSPTMFSRRVFELMACGTPVVSTYAKGIDELFESKAVWLVESQEEAERAIQVLLTNDSEWRRRSLLGIREVFSRHTYQHRLQEIFSVTHSDFRINVSPEVLVVVERQQSRAYSSMLNQSYENAVVVTKSELIKKPELTKNYEYIAYVSGKFKYGTHYIQDLVNATRYAPNANVWSKSITKDLFAMSKSQHPALSLVRSSRFELHDFLNAKLAKPFEAFVIDTDEVYPRAWRSL